METQELLFQSGTVWAMSTSTWSGTDALLASDLGKNDDEIPDIFRLGRKFLLPKEWRVKMQGSRSKINGLFSRIGRPFFLRGAYFVPNKNLVMAQEGWKKIEEYQESIVDDLIENLPQIKTERIEKYPVLAEAVWPNEQHVRNRFALKRVIFEVTGTSVKEGDVNELIKAKQEFQQELKQEYENLKREILAEAHRAIVENCEEIARKILATGDKITKATLKKPRQIVDQYDNVAAILDADEIRSEVDKLRTTVLTAEAKEIREDWAVAKEFATAMKKIGENIGDLTGINREGRAKRKVEF